MPAAVIVPDHMDAKGKVVHVCLLHAHIVNADLGIRHTTVVARLGVRLVLDLPVASRRACEGGVHVMMLVTLHDACALRGRRGWGRRRMRRLLHMQWRLHTTRGNTYVDPSWQPLQILLSCRRQHKCECCTPKPPDVLAARHTLEHSLLCKQHTQPNAASPNIQSNCSIASSSLTRSCCWCITNTSRACYPT